MNPLGWFHTLCALVALVSGAAVLLRPKGTHRHRQIGWIYVGSMVAVNVTALMIYRLFGGFGPFHVAALLSLATVIAGIIPAVRRRPPDRWLERHYFFMTYSYLGLLAATAAEIGTRLPAARGAFWWAVIVATIAVFVVGGMMIRRRAGPTLAKVRSAPLGEGVTDAGSALNGEGRICPFPCGPRGRAVLFPRNSMGDSCHSRHPTSSAAPSTCSSSRP